MQGVGTEMKHFIKKTVYVAGNFYNIIKDGIIKNFNDLTIKHNN